MSRAETLVSVRDRLNRRESSSEEGEGARTRQRLVGRTEEKLNGGAQAEQSSE